MRKYDIVNLLARKRGYRSYLEICTPFTGFSYGNVDRTQFPLCHRLVYLCPADFDDGAEVTFRSENENVSGLFKSNAGYECIFIDPFHTFECSYRDLALARSLLRPRGCIVIHDCSPANRELARPSFHNGVWCGATYCAYIEFVFAHPELSYYTVDTDHGCGVIWDRAEHQTGSRHELRELWRRERAQATDMFGFFDRRRRELLKLTSVREFLAKERVRRPWISELSDLAHKACSRARRLALGTTY